MALSSSTLAFAHRAPWRTATCPQLCLNPNASFGFTSEVGLPEVSHYLGSTLRGFLNACEATLRRRPGCGAAYRVQHRLLNGGR
ncbi:hypothetical protein CSUI_005589 [Cystoisospora suis]|uniref:Uncharacterized protein n=1 Tax=Cystoisospora suis TaxID=483139 RepID=A0A2C6K585_9APIC|nr:hypothetical protein CSUI_005589 [Cystoisospora suis]